MLLHACLGDENRERLGGAAGLAVMVRCLPPPAVLPWAHRAVRNLLSVVRRLPEPCVQQQAAVDAVLEDLPAKCLQAWLVASFDPGTPGEGGSLP